MIVGAFKEYELRCDESQDCFVPVIIHPFLLMFPDVVLTHAATKPDATLKDSSSAFRAQRASKKQLLDQGVPKRHFAANSKLYFVKY